MQAIEDFYKDLYSSKQKQFNEEKADIFLKSNNLPKLTDEDKQSCEGLLTKEECRKALKDMAPNKTPGNDGLPAEFYTKFWDSVGNIVVTSINEGHHKGEMSQTQRQGVINLHDKKNKDKLLIKNWRPITLLNVDTKIATKALANRMKKSFTKDHS